MNTTTKADLAAVVAFKTGVTIKTASAMITALQDEIKRQVVGGNAVTLRGLGVFKPVLFGGNRVSSLPGQEGKPITAKIKPRFTAYQPFIDAVSAVNPATQS